MVNTYITSSFGGVTRGHYCLSPGVVTNPTVHVFGHQHRNWDMVIAGVRYGAHCLGCPNDQTDGWTWGASEWDGQKQVWPPKM